ncbi:facilitated trehalose transporter Tret1-like, partial [Aricia agestis]|uniref:facilitated trehalose transporter Tret1-like n=1 Tax=Aricia agestis TaxID=91739 RepID=UPI001C205E3F
MKDFDIIVENDFIPGVKIAETSENDFNNEYKCNDDEENEDETKPLKCDISNLDESKERKLDISKDKPSKFMNSQTSAIDNKASNYVNCENKRENDGTISDNSHKKGNELSENYSITETYGSRIPPNWKQFISASGPIALYFSTGISSGFSATLIPHLREEHSAILQNESSISWIASIAVLPLAPCCFIGGLLIEKFGRRRTLGTLGIPFFIGWIVVILSSSLAEMLIGRFINGCSIGIMMPSMSVFISESTSPKLRGMLLSLLPFSFALGIFISHLIGTWVSWQWTAIISAIFPLTSVFILLFVPESPKYHVLTD